MNIKQTRTRRETDVLNVLNSIYREKRKGNIDSVSFTEVFKKNRMSQAIPTLLVKAKFAKRPSKGVIQFTRKPNIEMVKAVIELESSFTRTFKKNSESIFKTISPIQNVLELEVKAERAPSSTFKITDEAAIAHLKAKGYKIQRPTTGYEEI